MRDLVGALAGIDDRTRRALLSGARTDACITHIRHIYKARKQKIPFDLDRVLIHLVHVNKARNTLLHYGARGKAVPARMAYTLPHVLTASNWHVALTDDDVQRLVVSTEMLNQLRLDTQEIIRVLRVFIQGGPSADVVGDPETSSDGPWLYKPPEQGKKNQHSPSRNQKRPPLPRSSRA